MSDGLPSDEQLRRIERGVLGRIDRRRRIARGVAGTTAGVLLLSAGIALLVPRPIGTSGGSSGGGSAAGGSSGSAARSSSVEVRCEPDGRLLEAPDEPERIAEACGAVAVDFQRSSGRTPSASPQGATPGPIREVVICRAEDGVLDVLPAGDRPRTACERAGLRPY